MCACTPHHAQVRITLTETPELKVDACPGCRFTSCLCANEAKTFVWNVTATRLGEVEQRDMWQLAGGGVEFVCLCMSGPDARAYSCLQEALSNVPLCSLQAK